MLNPAFLLKEALNQQNPAVTNVFNKPKPTVIFNGI